MARGNDLKLTPAHDSQLPPLAATSPGGATKFSGPDILSDDVEFFSGSEVNEDLLDVQLEEDPRAQIEGRDVQHDDQQDEEDDVEGYAGLINDASLSGLSHQSPAAANKPSGGIWGMVTAVFTPHKQPKTSQESTNPELQIKPRRGSERVLRSTEQRLSTIARVMSAPISLASEVISSKKNPMVSGLPDVYDVPESPLRSPAVEIKANNDRKRNPPKPKKLVVSEKAKNNGIHADEDVYLEALDTEEQNHVEVAKQARSLPTRGASATIEQLASPQRMTRSSGAEGGKSIAHSQRPKKIAHQPLDGSPELGRPSVSQAPKPKAKRGRPRKDQNGTNQPQRPITDSAVIGDATVRFNVNTMRRNDKTGEYEILQGDTEEQFGVRATTESEQVAGEEEPAELDWGDVSDVLMDPSPIKAIQPQPPAKQARKLIRPSSAAKDLKGDKGGVPSQHMPRTHHEPGLARSRDPENFRASAGKYRPETAGSSDHYDSYDDDNDSLIHELDVSNVYSSQSKAEPVVKANSYFINEQIMDDMLSHMKKVGRDKNGKMAAPDAGFETAIGKQMSKAAEKLASGYIFMEELKSADVVDLQKVSIQQERVSALLAKLEALTGTMLNDQLGDRSTGVKKKGDTFRTKKLYDLYMYVIPKAVDALYASAKRYWKQPSPDTADLEEFTALLKVIFELAKAARAEDKDVQQKARKDHSYKLAKPTVLLLPIVRELIGKCSDELAARKVGEARKVAAERARKRKKLSEEQERADEEDYLRRLKERNRAILISLKKSRASLGLPPSSQQNGAQISGQPHWDIADNEEFSDQSDDAELERLSLFGRNNSHPEKIPREWTKEEMEVLVDVLWRERGPTRYEKLAMRLDRTMDEIFERAKYFKQQVQYTINRKQEENPDAEHAKMEPWVENIGHEF